MTQIIGLTGKLGSGKDTVLARLQDLFGGTGSYQRVSFADKLKESAAALFGVTLEHLEMMKNEPSFRVNILNIRGYGQELGRSLSIREMLQRYGTEAHRNIFGDDFWVEAAMRGIEELAPMPYQGKPDKSGPILVFTDVRFDNEARAIIERGGRIYRVIGPNEDTGDHVSEAGIADNLVVGEIDNSHRPEYIAMISEDPGVAEAALAASFAALDDEVATLHAELQSLRS